jgi:hypothetical protein
VSDPLSAIANAARAIIAAKNNDYLGAAGYATEAALDLVPHDQAKQILSEAVFRRVNAEAEIAEAEKFGRLADLDDPGDEPTNPGAE